MKLTIEKLTADNGYLNEVINGLREQVERLTPLRDEKGRFKKRS